MRSAVSKRNQNSTGMFTKNLTQILQRDHLAEAELTNVFITQMPSNILAIA